MQDHCVRVHGTHSIPLGSHDRSAAGLASRGFLHGEQHLRVILFGPTPFHLLSPCTTTYHPPYSSLSNFLHILRIFSRQASTLLDWRDVWSLWVTNLRPGIQRGRRFNVRDFFTLWTLCCPNPRQLATSYAVISASFVGSLVGSHEPPCSDVRSAEPHCLLERRQCS